MQVMLFPESRGKLAQRAALRHGYEGICHSVWGDWITGSRLFRPGASKL
jgi:hypothetical protein